MYWGWWESGVCVCVCGFIFMWPEREGRAFKVEQKRVLRNTFIVF